MILLVVILGFSTVLLKFGCRQEVGDTVATSCLPLVLVKEILKSSLMVRSGNIRVASYSPLKGRKPPSSCMDTAL